MATSPFPKVVKQPKILVPCYEPQVAVFAMYKMPPKEKRDRLILLLNPNSGPGTEKSKPYSSVFKTSVKRKHEIAFYINCTEENNRKKNTEQIQKEIELYFDFYGIPDYFFLDNYTSTLDKTRPEILRTFKKYKPKIIINPGSNFPTDDTSIFVCVHEMNGIPSSMISERQGAISLGLKEKDILTFRHRTTFAHFRYASELKDDWQNNRSAYNTLSEFYISLF